MPRAVGLSGDGGPEARCPTCQSVTARKLARSGWGGQTTRLAEVGSDALLSPDTPAPVAKPGLPGPLLWHGGPVGRGRAGRRDGKRYQTALQQAGRQGTTSTAKDSTVSLKARMPTIGTDPELPAQGAG